MAPPAFLAALVAGLRGETTDEFGVVDARRRSMPHARQRGPCVRAVRLALHKGRLDDAADEIERHRAALPGHDSELPLVARPRSDTRDTSGRARPRSGPPRGEPDAAERIALMPRVCGISGRGAVSVPRRGPGLNDDPELLQRGRRRIRVMTALRRNLHTDAARRARESTGVASRDGR